MTPRKQSKYQLCDRHRPWFTGETRYRQLECMVEGGPGGWAPGCSGGKCRLWPGLDVFEPSVCNGDLILEWTYADTPAERLEYLRTQLDAESISYGELAELQGLADHIDPSDVQLLEAAGVPEHPTDWNADFDPQTLDPMFKERGLQTDIERYGHKAAWR